MSKEQNNNLVNNCKITLSYTGLTHIGDISNIFRNLTKLYLSNNKIISLNGIEAFQHLTHFSISFNHLEKIHEMDKIKNPKLIQVLSIKGNLFCKNPLTNVFIIEKFQNLKDLDGYKISDSSYKVIEGNKFV